MTRNPLRRAARVTAKAARRITGGSFSLLGFGGGVQLSDPGPAQREIVRRFLVALEDRRVLYNPMQLEVRSQVEHSVHQIRQACTEALQQLAEGDFAGLPVRAIREACRRYHDDAGLDVPHMGAPRASMTPRLASSWRSARSAPRSATRWRCWPPTTTSTWKVSSPACCPT